MTLKTRGTCHRAAFASNSRESFGFGLVRRPRGPSAAGRELGAWPVKIAREESPRPGGAGPGRVGPRPRKLKPRESPFGFGFETRFISGSQISLAHPA